MTTTVSPPLVTVHPGGTPAGDGWSGRLYKDQSVGGLRSSTRVESVIKSARDDDKRGDDYGRLSYLHETITYLAAAELDWPGWSDGMSLRAKSDIPGFK